MEKFKQRFIDEAQEYFDRLESGLLSLEKDFFDQQLIDEVFRIMHSLKGSGAMFGFDLLSEVTHDLESLYEMIRNQEIQLDSKIVSFTLTIVDELRQLLVLNPDDSVRELANEIKSGISILLEDKSILKKEQPDLSIEVEPQRVSTEKSFFIYFQPHESVFVNGTNPLYMVDEIATLGESKVEVYFQQLPDFAVYEPEKCYTSWRMVLCTSEELETIEDVFLFVQDDAVIQIVELQCGNVFADEKKLASYFTLPLEEIKSFEKEQPEILGSKENTLPPKIVTEEKRKELVAGVQLSTIRVNSVKIDEYMNLVSEMITAQSQLDLLAEKNRDIVSISEHFSKLIRQLRDNAFDMSLIPLNNMATRFKRLVRDLSADLNKQVELVTEGLETEVDKNIIEQLAEPLLHIIRNCIDHGIEPVEERARRSKSKVGLITIKASYVGTFVEIEITDDGRGLDLDRIREKALGKHLISADEEVSNSTLISLIFESGFSTSDHLSDVSGRGVGMDVVRQRIKDLRGDIEVDTKKGEGTTFTIRLPLTLSIIDGLLTRVNDDMYVIPTGAIEKIYALTSEHKTNALRQVVVFENTEIPYLDLRKEFDPEASELKQQYLIAVNYQNKLFGLVVDDVLREYQAVVKPLGQMLKDHDLFLGASILGDGKVSLVIDVKKTIQKFSA